MTKRSIRPPLSEFQAGKIWHALSTVQNLFINERREPYRSYFNELYREIFSKLPTANRPQAQRTYDHLPP
jgi:hypothetical protein